MSTTLTGVEIYLPIEYLEEALMRARYDPKCLLQKRGIFPTLQEPVCLSFLKQDTHLKIMIDRFHLIQTNDILQCKINTFHEEIKNPSAQEDTHNDHVNAQTLQNESDVSLTHVKDSAGSKDPSCNSIQKRKRGRPRKKHSLQSSCDRSAETGSGNLKNDITGPCGNEVSNSGESTGILKDAMQNAVDLCEGQEHVLKSTDQTRYSLRGKKLNPQIMAFVKGFDENSETNSCKGHSDDETVLSDGSSHEEVKRYKKVDGKSAQKHKYVTDSKTRRYLKEIRSKVEEILWNGRGKYEQNEEKNVICKICEEKLCNSHALHKHVLQLHEKSENVDVYIEEISSDVNSAFKDNKCFICGEEFNDSISLKNHQVTAHTDFECPLCEYKSKNIASLKIHVRKIHVEVGKKAFCHLCTASFRSQGSLKQHIELNHYGNKRVSCDICKKQFYNKSQLRRHLITHGLGAAKSLRCDICGKSFSFEYNLKRHIKDVHQPQSECFHCSYCGKGFSQKVPMISHVQLVHFNLFPYTCKECKINFPKALLLKEHMQTIHQQANFEVPVIPRNSVYDKTDEDKFYCVYCNESFAHKIRLIEHMHFDHADAFPFKCETCVQGFIEQSFLVLHMLKAHGVLIQNENEIPKHSDSAGDIMQIITNRNGYPNKVVQTVSGEEPLPDNDKNIQETPEDVVSTEPCAPSEAPFTEIIPPVTSNTPSSLLVEVAQGSNTYQYVIEAPESLGQSGSELAVDIANLLLAAEKSTQEVQQDSETGASSVEEINLIIDNCVQNQEAALGSDPQTVQVLLGQNDQDISLVTADNQSLPMEVVIDETEQNRAVLTIENQAQPLEVEHGDIIELNDSNSDGRNYYRIINVLDNQ